MTTGSDDHRRPRRAGAGRDAWKTMLGWVAAAQAGSAATLSLQELSHDPAELPRRERFSQQEGAHGVYTLANPMVRRARQHDEREGVLHVTPGLERVEPAVHGHSLLG